MREWKHYGLVVVAAVIGVVFAVGARHAYQDHLAVHAVVDYLNKAVAAQQKAATAPTPGVAEK